MKLNLIVLFATIVLIVPSICVFAIDPNSIEYRASEVITMVEQLPVKKKALDEKVYSGTMEDILDVRIVDLNEVIIYSEQIEEKANKVVEDAKLKSDDESAVKTIIKQFNNREKIAKQKSNNEFLAAVTDLLNDPNRALPDPEDPNYVEKTQRNAEFLAACIEVAQPK